MTDQWYLGSMNDGLFIINTPPRPSTDDIVHDRKDGPTMVLNITELPNDKGQAICDAHNSARRPAPTGMVDQGARDELISRARWKARHVPSPVVSALLVELADALTAAAGSMGEPALEGDGWQPIETAPATGEFLAFGSYVYEGDSAPTIYYRVAERTGIPEWPWEDEDGQHPADFFSHWQPLPAAPKPSAGPDTANPNRKVQ